MTKRKLAGVLARKWGHIRIDVSGRTACIDQHVYECHEDIHSDEQTSSSELQRREDIGSYKAELAIKFCTFCVCHRAVGGVGGEEKN